MRGFATVRSSIPIIKNWVMSIQKGWCAVSCVGSWFQDLQFQKDQYHPKVHAGSKAETFAVPFGGLNVSTNGGARTGGTLWKMPT